MYVVPTSIVYVTIQNTDTGLMLWLLTCTSINKSKVVHNKLSISVTF